MLQLLAVLVTIPFTNNLYFTNWQHRTEKRY